jgi:hypothetical protein
MGPPCGIPPRPGVWRGVFWPSEISEGVPRAGLFVARIFEAFDRCGRLLCAKSAFSGLLRFQQEACGD